jgi:hypothetical protein
MTHDPFGLDESRVAELNGKRRQITEFLREKGADAILISRHDNIAWTTAGVVDVRIVLLRESGAASLLITREGGAYYLTTNNEERRLAEEEFAGLGFEPVVNPWYANDLRGAIAKIVRVFTVVLPRSSILRLRQKSILRGIVLSVGAFVGSLLLAGFPHVQNLHGTDWQYLPLLVALWGMAETARCLRRRWSFYHAGVMILLYSDLIILAVIAALLVLA